MLGESAAADIPAIWHDSQDADPEGATMHARRTSERVTSAAALGSTELLATAAAPAGADDINTYGGYIAGLMIS